MGVSAKSQDSRDGLAVFAFERVDQVQALFYLVQALGVEFDAFQVGAQAAGDFAQVLEKGLGLLAEGGLLGVQAGQVGQGMGDRAEQIGGGWGFGAAFIQGQQGFLAQARQSFGVGQAVAFIAQLLIFPGEQVSGFDLVDLEGEHLDPPRRVALGLADAFQLALRLLQALVSVLVSAEDFVQ